MPAHAIKQVVLKRNAMKDWEAQKRILATQLKESGGNTQSNVLPTDPEKDEEVERVFSPARPLPSSAASATAQPQAFSTFKHEMVGVSEPGMSSKLYDASLAILQSRSGSQVRRRSTTSGDVTSRSRPELRATNAIDLGGEEEERLPALPVSTAAFLKGFPDTELVMFHRKGRLFLQEKPKVEVSGARTGLFEPVAKRSSVISQQSDLTSELDAPEIQEMGRVTADLADPTWLTLEDTHRAVMFSASWDGNRIEGLVRMADSLLDAALASASMELGASGDDEFIAELRQHPLVTAISNWSMTFQVSMDPRKL